MITISLWFICLCSYWNIYHQIYHMYMVTYSCNLERKLPWMVILDMGKHNLWETIMNYFPYLKMESDWATHHYCNYVYTYISVTILLTLYKRLLSHWTHQWFKYNSKTISFSSDNTFLKQNTSVQIHILRLISKVL